MSQPTDHDFIERELRPWLAEEGMVREPDDLLERVASRTRGLRQRPGWVVRLMGSSTGGAEAEPAARWREHRMAMAFGLGTLVVVAALGIGGIGSGLVGPGSAPGTVYDAESPSATPVLPVWVTGTVTGGDVQSYGRSWSEDGINYAEGPWWTITLEASDPRLSAAGTYSQNWHESESADQFGIGTQTYVLDTPDGRWAGSGDLFLSSSEAHSMVVLHGEGAYEGLTAKILISSDFSSPDTFVGVITPGQLPAIPEPVEPPVE